MIGAVALDPADEDRVVAALMHGDAAALEDRDAIDTAVIEALRATR